MPYKSKDRKTGELFKELFPYGGQPDANNRWMKLSELIPWDESEDIYRKYFSSLGRRDSSIQFKQVAQEVRGRILSQI